MNRVLDIGGGVGHLARTLAHFKGIPTTTIDFNKELQSAGIKRASKYPLPKEASPLHFIHHQFSDIEYNRPIKSLINKNCLTIGLHTCGSLAKQHMETAIKFGSGGILNFGCCYNKLLSENDYNLSQLAKQNPLKLSEHALTLATRGYTVMNLKQFRIKERVKNHRYKLHLLLNHEFNQKEFIPMGEIPVKNYFEPFAIYAKDKLKKLNLECHLSDRELENFYQSDKIQLEFQRLYFSNMIRWQLGRIMEFYILLDRALYLEDHGMKVSVNLYFDQNLSPRNIGIFGHYSG